VKENTDLKEKLKKFENREYILQIYTDVINKNNEIAFLRRENEDLKKRIEFLEIQNRNQGMEIVELKQEIVELKQEIVELKQENKEIKQELNRYRVRELFNQTIRAIQDVNRTDQLEKRIKSKTLYKLRKQRVDISHYINDEEDTPEEKDKKKKFLSLYFEKIDKETVEVIYRKFTKELIDDIMEYLKDTYGDIELTEEEINEYTEWWEFC
jgi:chromosome segregation ATPase